MTREEALRVLNDIGRYCLYYMGEATRQNSWERYERLLILYQTAEIAIKALQQPEQRQGKWIWVDEIDSCSYTCSECSHHAYGNTGEVLGGEYKYCPHCGAEMEVEE